MPVIINNCPHDEKLGQTGMSGGVEGVVGEGPWYCMAYTLPWAPATPWP